MEGKEYESIAPINDPAVKKIQPFDYFLVLDFEATCDEGRGFKHPEIIEFPTVLWNSHTEKVEDEFHHYIKPTLNPKLTPFCTQLTGIQQSTVDSGIILSDALIMYDKWLISKGLIEYDNNNKLVYKKNFAFVTCGDWDLDKMLPVQCKREKLKRSEYLKEWINIKKSFANFYHRENAAGMAGMLKILGMDLLGHHHSGIDDCRNICRILQRLINDGVLFQKTASNFNVDFIEEKVAEVKIDACENPKLVKEVLEASKKYITADVLKQVMTENKFTQITKVELPKVKGLMTKFINNQLKDSFPIDTIKASDKKSITETITKDVAKFIEENQSK